MCLKPAGWLWNKVDLGQMALQCSIWVSTFAKACLSNYGKYPKIFYTKISHKMA